jgi:hypothetical protein
MLKREITLKVKTASVENSYNVSFDNIGSFVEVESRKAQLANDRYLGLLKSNTLSSIKALDFIDMIAYYEVFIPALIKDLKVDSITQLGVIDANELLKTYKEQFYPWLKEWLKILGIIVFEEEDKKLEEDPKV